MCPTIHSWEYRTFLPGIQFADICAFVLRRRADGDSRFEPWVDRLKAFEWKGRVNGFPSYGIRRWHENDKGKLVVCHEWKEKRKLGGTGQVPD